MKRKTNLFYYTGDESNFLTFSNYTEHLTGNFLATNYKLFPTRFICLYIPELNDQTNKANFIKNYLVGYYENKLAFLRDHYIDIKGQIDNEALYTNYLFEAIYKYTNKSSIFSNMFIGKITEQNYNGTFTDIICTIDYNESDNYTLSLMDGVDSILPIEYANDNKKLSTTYLYNWYYTDVNSIENYNGPNNDYRYVQPLFDIDELDNKSYNITSIFESKFKKNNTKLNEIKFNIIIPLYDCVNVNFESNQTIIEKDLNEIELSNNYNDSLHNIPYGIWFANEDIILKRDTATGYAPSWSLLIGTQFKPFPNSKFIKMDNGDDSMSKAYATFAEILKENNNVINIISKYNTIITEMKNKINNIENNLTKILDVTEINKLKTEMEEIINRYDISSDKIINKWEYNN
jgi:hypothetical protein